MIKDNTFFLGDICEVIAGQSPPSNTYNKDGNGLPFFQGKADFGTYSPKVRIWCNAPQKIARKGDILFSVRAPVGPTNVCEQDCCIGRGLSAIRAKDKINSKYLRYFLQKIEPIISGKGRGSTFSSITQKDLKEIKVFLPLLKKQKQIVQILDTADTLRQKRKEQLNLLDDYLKSVFFEMFGDPVNNDKGWEIYKFGDVCPTRLGKMLDAKKQTGRNPKQYLRNQNVLWGKFNLNEIAVMDFDMREQKEFRLIKGDVLICEGGEVGRTAIWNDDMTECFFQKALHRGRPNIKHILPLYILFLMWMYSKYGGFKDYVSSVTIAHLTGEKLKSMKIPVPPIELQNKFALIVEQAEQTKQIMCTSLDEMDNHFNALMQRYFG